MARFPIVFTTLFVFAAFNVAYTQPLRRATSFGIPVRIIREGNNQLLWVSEEGAVFSDGSNSETGTCFKLFPGNAPGIIELKSAKYEGVFIGIAQNGTVMAAPKQELYASTFEITAFTDTPLRLVNTDVPCALSFADDGTANNACSSDTGSGPAEDLFSFYEDFVCI